MTNEEWLKNISLEEFVERFGFIFCSEIGKEECLGYLKCFDCVKEYLSAEHKEKSNDQL
jgi:hypothetical protein